MQLSINILPPNKKNPVWNPEDIMQYSTQIPALKWGQEKELKSLLFGIAILTDI